MNAGAECRACYSKATVGAAVKGGVRWTCSTCGRRWTARLVSDQAEPLGEGQRQWWT